MPQEKLSLIEHAVIGFVVTATLCLLLIVVVGVEEWWKSWSHRRRTKSPKTPDDLPASFVVLLPGIRPRRFERNSFGQWEFFLWNERWHEMIDVDGEDALECYRDPRAVVLIEQR